MRYVELCAGMGGTRAGLEAAGWTCCYSADVDRDAVDVQRLAFGSCERADVRELTPADLPDAEVFVAGFPCQPFSSSGHRSGFDHHSGNVFEHLARLVMEKAPDFVLFENVQGLVHNKSGHTFARVLQSLTELGYTVDWLLADLRWFGAPQTRPRTLLIASRKNLGNPVEVLRAPLVSDPRLAESTFATLIKEFGLQLRPRDAGSIAAVESRTRPEIGKAKPTGRMPFGKAGRAIGDEFVSYTFAPPKDCVPVSPFLRDVVAPDFAHADAIKSARYWAYDGPSSLHLRDRPVSHCVGTSLGGAPLFGVPLPLVSGKRDRAAFLHHADWSREEDGHLVMRLRPERASRLFGQDTETLEQALIDFDAGATRKFVLVGNLMAPVMSKRMAEIVTDSCG